jgi:hypothetical protein
MSVNIDGIRETNKIAELRAIIVEYKKIEANLKKRLVISDERIEELQVMLQKADCDLVDGD